MDNSVEDTLPDHAWKDSFDKLLDQRPILRELNLIKRSVRASFNMNSSYENTSNNSESGKLQCEVKQKVFKYPSSDPSVVNLDLPEKLKSNKGNIDPKLTSTPLRNDNSGNPFKCTLSPVGSWELHYFKCVGEKDIAQQDTKQLHKVTPSISNVGINLDVNAVKDTSPAKFSLGISPLEIVRKKWKLKPRQKQVCFVDNTLFERDEKNIENAKQATEVIVPSLSFKFGLQTGKWRKSLNCLRRSQNCIKNNTYLKPLKEQYCKGRTTSVTESPKSLTTAINVAGNRKSVYVCPNSKGILLPQTGSTSTYSLENNDFKRQILQRCGQGRILSFSSAYNDSYLRNCCKIGEGAFGEVFVYSKRNNRDMKNNYDKTVLKIIPIEGKELVNGEVQKTFEQILPEIIISMELCGLNDDNRKANTTSGFVNLQRVRCVKGRYPSYFQKLWEEYDVEKESENDHPKLFTDNQQYVILELAYGGKDLESCCFTNAEQSFYTLLQIILTLAVGEKEYQFEHRDLHWGNILVLTTNKQHTSFKLNDHLFIIPTKGIQITIIDYTLSRMTFNGCCLYNDLSSDEELFTATGDYQFEIYRMMRNVLNNKWETFEPKTNIFWISYIISKLVDGVRYRNTGSRNHLQHLDKLKQLQTSILTYKSCASYAEHVLLY